MPAAQRSSPGTARATDQAWQRERESAIATAPPCCCALHAPERAVRGCHGVAGEPVETFSAFAVGGGCCACVQLACVAGSHLSLSCREPKVSEIIHLDGTHIFHHFRHPLLIIYCFWATVFLHM
eukprot:5620319-Pleurochrysis_carterae.AAC.1